MSRHIIRRTGAKPVAELVHVIDQNGGRHRAISPSLWERFLSGLPRALFDNPTVGDRVQIKGNVKHEGRLVGGAVCVVRAFTYTVDGVLLRLEDRRGRVLNVYSHEVSVIAKAGE